MFRNKHFPALAEQAMFPIKYEREVNLMELLKKYLQSLSEEEVKEVKQEGTLQKSVQDTGESIEDLLKKVDGVADLSKAQESNIPENATINASNEKAESKEDVFSVEDDKDDMADEKGESVSESNIDENSTIDASKEKAESNEDVFSVEKQIDGTPPASNNAKVSLQKSEDKEDYKEEDKKEDKKDKKDDKKEDKKEDKKDDKNFGDNMMKSAGLSDNDLDVFDVTEPLTNLKKSYDVLAEQVQTNKSTLGEIKDLFKSLLDVQVKGYDLQTKIAGTVDAMSSQPNAPKGVVNVLQKQFAQNNEAQQNANGDQPSIDEFTQVLLKGIEEKKINVNTGGNLIASAESSRRLGDNHMKAFNELK